MKRNYYRCSFCGRQKKDTSWLDPWTSQTNQLTKPDPWGMGNNWVHVSTKMQMPILIISDPLRGGGWWGGEVLVCIHPHHHWMVSVPPHQLCECSHAWLPNEYGPCIDSTLHNTDSHPRWRMWSTKTMSADSTAGPIRPPHWQTRHLGMQATTGTCISIHRPTTE